MGVLQGSAIQLTLEDFGNGRGKRFDLRGPLADMALEVIVALHAGQLVVE